MSIKLINIFEHDQYEDDSLFISYNSTNFGLDPVGFFEYILPVPNPYEVIYFTTHDIDNNISVSNYYYMLSEEENFFQILFSFNGSKRNVTITFTGPVPREDDRYTGQFFVHNFEVTFNHALSIIKHIIDKLRIDLSKLDTNPFYNVDFKKIDMSDFPSLYRRYTQGPGNEYTDDTEDMDENEYNEDIDDIEDTDRRRKYNSRYRFD